MVAIPSSISMTRPLLLAHPLRNPLALLSSRIPAITRRTALTDRTALAHLGGHSANAAGTPKTTANLGGTAEIMMPPAEADFGS
jgi:hypothetical protein